MDFWQCMLHADLLHDYPEFLNKPESSLVCANNFRSAINLLQRVQRCSTLTNLIPTQGNVRYYVINVSQLLPWRLLMKLATRAGSGQQLLRKSYDEPSTWYLLISIDIYWYLAAISMTNRNQMESVHLSAYVCVHHANVCWRQTSNCRISPSNFRTAKTIALDLATQPTSQQGSHCHIKLVIDVGDSIRL